MYKIVVLLVVCLTIASCIGYYSINNKEKINIEDKYQGPVPEGYNLQHFRETGETIKEVEKELNG